MEIRGGIQFPLIVNTFPTKRIPHIFFSVDGVPFYPSKKESVELLLSKILSLPARYNPPRSYSILSFPRYYMIVVDDIVDIIGVRLRNHNIFPTKWGYRVGFWHPHIHILIIDAINNYLNTTSE